MDLSIIIVNWNTRDLLKQCLESVYKSQPTVARQASDPSTGDCLLSTEVFVVDNTSSDGSVAMVRARFPRIHLIENSENVGFSHANNQAISASSGRYVLLLNSDTVVQPNALARLVAFMDAHPQSGIVGAYILNPDGSPQYCFGRFPTLISELTFAWGLNTHYPFSMWFSPTLGFEDGWIETDWVVGAALMVRRAALDRVGLLDESYFMYSEEIDLAWRVRRAGWKTYVLRGAPVVHWGQQSSRQIPAVMKAQLFRSKILYFRKNHGRVAAFLLKIILGSSILSKSVVYRLQRQMALAQLWQETWHHFSAIKSSP